MARGDQLGRQWRVIQKLILSRHGKSVGELAADLACHPRTVYRDLEALQIAGFPIYADRVDGKNLWSVLDTIKHRIPIPFSFSELMALYFSRDMLKVFQGTFIFESLESLFQKIKTTLPEESLRYLENVGQTLHVGIRPYKEYDRFKEIIRGANDAARERKRVEIAYFAMSRGKESKRKVDPYRIWFFNGTFYMVGYCHLRREVRIFALDRIKMLHQTGESFDVPDDFDLEDFMGQSFGVYRGETEKVKIRFSADIAGYIKEKIWHESQKVTSRKDGSLILEAEVAGIDEIRFWVMTWGAGAEVLEPASLRERIQAEAERMLETYRGKRGTKGGAGAL